MRKLRYCVASSLDGFIAGPKGEYDWIVMDPSIDFGALFRQFDTFVMGRKTFDVTGGQGGGQSGTRTVVFSRTLPPLTKKGLTITADDPVKTVAALKEEDGKDIWLFGGGELCRTLLDAGLVDTIELGIMPVLVGRGIPLVAPGRTHGPMKLVKSETLPSGIVMAIYEVTATKDKNTKHTKKTDTKDTKKRDTKGTKEDTTKHTKEANGTKDTKKKGAKGAKRS